MFCIGIPTLNEADNIVQLTKQIDQYAQEIGIQIILINADSGSIDGTPEKFLQTETKCEKRSFKLSQQGKGRAVLRILKHAETISDLKGCLLIDGDIKSLTPAWIKKFTAALIDGADYVLPNYKRNFQEGNTTNHFVFPLLTYHFGQACPRQPISGDCALSLQLIRAVLSSEIASPSVLRYGIDIFLTLNALYGAYTVKEISLDKKIHNASFLKMAKMFPEVATSYLSTSRSFWNDDKTPSAQVNNELQQQIYSNMHFLDPKDPIVYEKITDLVTGFPETKQPFSWAKKLCDFEQDKREDIDSIVKELTPFFLVQVKNYLLKIHSIKEAREHFCQEINSLFQLSNTEIKK
ncbi:glycosyltransferase [Listeria sp. PSOL-1]|uniref:glycosyltransferase n=1 Tax=Listeria sp. PSOL-1 TaxID=1844999 RepID=UPI0013CFF843|nr:glycosyltransferase family 2 protein [Listeria sp. PSOL-1]